MKPSVCGVVDEVPNDCEHKHVCYLYTGHEGDHRAKKCFHYFDNERGADA